ncbi:MAG: hypothetical protein ACLUNQ_09570 [Oscillospiraceae bacterium]
MRYYVQPRPLPESVRPRAEAAPVKKKKKGRVIFAILAAVLAVIIGVTALLVNLLGSDDTGADDNHAGSIVDISSDDGCHIPTADPAPEVRLNLVAPGEQALTAVDVFQKMSPSTVTVLATDAYRQELYGHRRAAHRRRIFPHQCPCGVGHHLLHYGPGHRRYL